MESGQPSATEQQDHDYDLTASGLQQQNNQNDFSSSSQTVLPTELREPSPPSEEPRRTSTPTKDSENKLRPAADIINRIIWDEKFDSNDYTIVYEDRFAGRLEAGLGSWKKDLTDDEFIPQHRIVYIKRRSDGDVVWDKRRRIDKIFLSGNSAFDYLAFLA